MIKKWLRKIILSSWLSDYAFNGLKPALQLHKLSDQNLKEYSQQCKMIRDNLAYKHIQQVLIHQYQSKAIKKAIDDELYWSRAYLKILDELDQLVIVGISAHDQRELSKGKQKKYR